MFNDYKNFVVTGGLGMVGSNFCRCIPSGINVIIIDNDYRGMGDHTSAFIQENRPFKLVSKDVRDVSCADIEDLLVPGKVAFVHLADIVAGIGFVFSNQYTILKENVSIDTAAFELAKTINSKLIIYASTACVFNQESQRSLDAKVSMKSDLLPANPESTYGWAKFYGELALNQLVANSNVKTRVIYFHNIIGFPCDYWSDKSQFVPGLINRALNLDEGDNDLSVWGSGNQGRALVPVSMVANELLAACADQYPEKSQFGPQFCTSVKDTAYHIASYINKSLKISFDKSKPEGDIGRSPVREDVVSEQNVTWNCIQGTLDEVVDWIAKSNAKNS
jgi:nucleoside-diphosphate-sugar epimerase